MESMAFYWVKTYFDPLTYLQGSGTPQLLMIYAPAHLQMTMLMMMTIRYSMTAKFHLLYIIKTED